MFRFEGRVLRVDLTSGKVAESLISDRVALDYIGGRGLAARLLLDELAPHIDPLGPDNVLVFLTGPLTGTPFPGTGKFVVATKSPATGAFCDSHSSGLLAAAMRFAGHDVLVITGRAPVPSYLWIDDAGVEIVPAGDLWGTDALTAEHRLRERYGHTETGVATIGPAGENLVKFAAIGSDYYRHAARGGVGAVMGSKNLKGLVVRGSGSVDVHDPVQMMALQAAQIAKLPGSVTAQSRIKYGTPATYAAINAASMLPTRNFQQGTFSESLGKLDGEGIRAITTGSAGCYGCIMPCSRIVEVERGGKRIALEGPEYEIVSMLGSNLGVADPAIVMHANLLCDQLGLDAISAGGVIAFAMECTERGLLGEWQAAGLRFGDGEGALRLLEDIAARRGIGDLLADGVREAARQIGEGSDGFAMHVKGLELPGYDPRAGFGTGLTYAVTPRGGCHRRAWPPAKEVLGNVPPYTIQGKAALVKETFDQRAVLHSLVACDFHPGAMPTKLMEYAEFVKVTTGYEYSAEEWQECAERIETTIRLFNIREGLSRADDNLPRRLLHETLPDGPARGQLFGQGGLDTMLDEFYALRGWDPQGVPRPETLARLNIATKDH